MEENKILNEADLARERQRSESEARSTIHDLDRLYTFPEERKSRWVWELLKNAKDVADKDGVDITFKLTDDHLIFSHNRLPFRIEHMVPILYKTSTKSLNGKGGTTGKYGTGFVTTHILNKKLKIAGIQENTLGKRQFELEIDRTAAGLDESIALTAIQESLSTSFGEIDKISKTPPEEINTTIHSFTYSLTPSSRIYAEKGLQELEPNIAFTARPEDDLIVDKEYFIKESRFVLDIGHQISDKIQNWDDGLQKLIIDDDVMVYLDDKTESIYVRRDIWRNGISFNEFVEILNQYFAT